MFISRRTLPVIDKTNKNGSMEFSIPGSADDFFPVTVTFHSAKTTYTDIKVIFYNFHFFPVIRVYLSYLQHVIKLP